MVISCLLLRYFCISVYLQVISAWHNRKIEESWLRNHWLAPFINGKLVPGMLKILQQCNGLYSIYLCAICVTGHLSLRKTHSALNETSRMKIRRDILTWKSAQMNTTQHRFLTVTLSVPPLQFHGKTTSQASRRIQTKNWTLTMIFPQACKNKMHFLFWWTSCKYELNMYHRLHVYCLLTEFNKKCQCSSYAPFFSKNGVFHNFFPLKCTFNLILLLLLILVLHFWRFEPGCLLKDNIFW